MLHSFAEMLLTLLTFINQKFTANTMGWNWDLGVLASVEMLLACYFEK